MTQNLRVLKICVKNNISPSIRAGGYGTAGWAVNGDIVIDLSEINDIQIEEPSPSGSFTSLKDSVYHAKGKGTNATTLVATLF